MKFAIRVSQFLAFLICESTYSNDCSSPLSSNYSLIERVREVTERHSNLRDLPVISDRGTYSTVHLLIVDGVELALKLPRRLILGEYLYIELENLERVQHENIVTPVGLIRDRENVFLVLHYFRTDSNSVP